MINTKGTYICNVCTNYYGQPININKCVINHKCRLIIWNLHYLGASSLKKPIFTPLVLTSSKIWHTYHFVVAIWNNVFLKYALTFCGEGLKWFSPLHWRVVNFVFDKSPPHPSIHIWVMTTFANPSQKMPC